MINHLKSIIVCFLVIVTTGCNNTPQNIPAYTISKIFRTDSVTTVNVHISNRMPVSQLLLIAGKLKTDSDKIQNLEVHYLLPGNADISMGSNSYYASARLLKAGEVKPDDSLKDSNGNIVRIKIFGLNAEKVKRLLTLQPKEIAVKNALGKFIDDYNHTVIIPFKDSANEVKIIELDSTAKIVSATVPLKIMDGKIEKWQVTQHGDYMTLKDSVLSQYSADGLGVPFNSIKSGI